MATFGKTVKGGTSWDVIANRQIACKFSLGEDGTVSSISVYVDYSDGGTIKCAVYADSAGVPGALQGVTEELDVVTEIGYTEGWMTFNFSPTLSLSAGTYWLVFWTKFANTFFYDAGSTNQTALKGITYNSWQDPFGAVDAWYDYEMSIYATYTGVAVKPSGSIVTLMRGMDLIRALPFKKRFPKFTPRTVA